MKNFLVIFSTAIVFNAFCITKSISYSTSDSTKILKIAGDLNEDIIDYIFVDNNRFIQLSKIKKTYFLKVPEENNVIKVYPLDIVPESLYKDAAGKIYILTKEKAFQIEIKPKLEFKVFYTKTQFENNIVKMISKTNSITISEYLDRKNNEYGLIQTSISDGISKILVFKQTPKEREELYNPEKIGRRIDINCYNENRYRIKDYEPILTFEKTGKMPRKTKPIIYTTASFNQPYQKNIEFYDLKTQSFNIDSLIYTFDLIHNKLITYNILANTMSDVSFQLQNGEQSELVFDEITNEIYQSAFVKGTLTLYKIDLISGNLSEVIKLNSITFEKNIKINNGELYFSKLIDSGYNKLYKVTI